MTSIMWNVLTGLIKASRNAEHSLTIDAVNKRILDTGAPSKAYDYSKYADEIESVIAALIDNGYVARDKYGDLYLTHKGLHPIMYNTSIVVSLVIKDVLIPILVTILTTLILSKSSGK